GAPGTDRDHVRGRGRAAVRRAHRADAGRARVVLRVGYGLLLRWDAAPARGPAALPAGYRYSASELPVYLSAAAGVYSDAIPNLPGSLVGLGRRLAAVLAGRAGVAAARVGARYPPPDRADVVAGADRGANQLS